MSCLPPFLKGETIDNYPYNLEMLFLGAKNMKQNRRLNDDEIPQYVQQIITAILDGKIALGAGVHTAHVYHEAWCKIHKGGQCNCNPEIIIETPGDKRHD